MRRFSLDVLIHQAALDQAGVRVIRDEVAQVELDQDGVTVRCRDGILRGQVLVVCG